MLKTLLLILIIISHACLAADSDDFVIKVQTNFLGVTGADQFKIPTLASLTYNYDVDCNDDTINEAVGVTGDYICDYSSLGGVGIYTIRIKLTAGTGFPRIYFNGLGDKNKIISVEQWGKNKWASMNSAFEGAINLTTTATDSPDLSNASSLAEMFKDATSVNPNTTNWNTSTITSFTGMFQGATSANPDVSQWNTGLVQRFKYMFDGASSANPNTSTWDTTSVLEMEYMFRNATSANPVTSNWNIENVTSIQGMFEGVTLQTTTYDNILSTFAVQNVNTGLIFDGGNSKFCAQAAHDVLDIDTSWTLSDAGLDTNCPSPTDDFVITVKTDNSGTSANTEFIIPTKSGEVYDFNEDCDNDGINDILGATGDSTCSYPSAGTYTVRIKYNQVTNAGFPQIYFNGSGDKDKLLTIEQWGTNPWTSMDSAFKVASNLTTTAADIPDFSNMISMSQMFASAAKTTPETSNWNTSNIEDMSSMFLNAFKANPDTSNWNTSNVTITHAMFINALLATPDVSMWNTSNVTNMNSMFFGAISATPDISNWNLSSIIVPGSLEGMLNGISLPRSLYDTTLANFNAQITASGITFDAGNSKYCNVAAHDSLINTHGWTISDGGLDTNCPDSLDDFIIQVDTTLPGTSTNLQFKIVQSGPGYNYNVDCDDSNPGTNTATAQTGTYFCNYAIPGIYTIRISDNVGDKTGFPRFISNGSPDKRRIINLKQWGTSKWTSMNLAFFGAINMVVTATDAPDLSNVTDMSSMFINASLANPNTTNWDVSNIEDMSSMFEQAENANPDVSLWNTANVINMQFMFSGAISATPDISNWNLSSIIVPGSLEGMLNGISLPRSLYDTTLANFNAQITASGITFDAGNSKYCNVAAHDSLINTHGWTISDGGLDPNCPGPLDGFIIEVDTTISSQTSNPNTEFEINTIGGGYNYNVDCDDNNAGTNTATGQTGNYTCQYAIPGIYTIRISDNIGDKTGFPRIYSMPHLDADKIINLKQWGTGAWDSMSAAFIRVTNMTVTATDIPDLSNVLDMSAMFAYASSANPDVSGWNTANVTSMHSMFIDATSATPDISNWDLSGITAPFSMESMLNGISLPQSLYDATLANFDAQVTASGIVFDAGNSKYCNVSAHDSLINNHGWTITDGGVCDDIIFRNGFDIVTVTFKTADGMFEYDFSLVESYKLDSYPELIAKGFDGNKKTTIKIHIRKINNLIQISISYLNTDEFGEETWSPNAWQDLENRKLTSIYW